MKLDKRLNHPLLLRLREIAQETRLYLVGGAVRDWLLERETKDFDFTLKEGAYCLAKRVADSLGGSFVGLDEERDMARVVYEEFCLDFTGFKGASLEEDLIKRDFTINALSLDLREGRLIDPLAGRKDLKERRIRVISSSSFKDDPLRMLRAVRLAGSLSFAIEERTLDLIAKSKGLINDVSPERIASEFFSILELSSSYPYLLLLYRTGLLLETFTELRPLQAVAQNGFHHLNAFDHSMAAIEELERIVLDPGQISYWDSAKVKEHLEEALAHNHRRLSNLKLACLLHDLGKSETLREVGTRSRFINHEKVGADMASKICRRLKLSKKERDYIRQLVRFHMWPGYLACLDKITKKAILRFLRKTGDNCLDVLLLSLSDRYAAKGALTTARTLRGHKELVRRILEELFRQQELTPLPRLITGKDLINLFNLSPSPLIGKILKKVKEAYLAGEIKDRKEALDFVKGNLQSESAARLN